ncbi:hypothetical protein JTB14_004604 [Gonioctena quinquepunctata]|nr:hypothetical protein JTB14_004604 [Gonioctena quinquepunctata]
MANSRLNNWHSRVKLFDSLVVRILLDSIPVWGFHYSEILGIVQLKFFKRLLLPSNSPDYAVRLDTGRVKISYAIFKSTPNFLEKLLVMEDNRLPKICFSRLVSLNYTGVDIKYN